MVPCVGQLVEVDNGTVAGGQPVEHKVRTDESSATGYQNRGLVGLRVLFRRLIEAHAVTNSSGGLLSSVRYTADKTICSLVQSTGVVPICPKQATVVADGLT